MSAALMALGKTVYSLQTQTRNPQLCDQKKATDMLSVNAGLSMIAAVSSVAFAGDAGESCADVRGLSLLTEHFSS
jgi:hypothetical protein